MPLTYKGDRVRLMGGSGRYQLCVHAYGEWLAISNGRSIETAYKNGRSWISGRRAVVIDRTTGEAVPHLPGGAA